MDYTKFNEKFPLDEACWKGYKQLGMKKKSGKEVPNCVKEADDVDNEVEDKKEKSKKLSTSEIELNPKLEQERT